MRVTPNTCALAALAVAVGLTASACNGSTESAAQTTTPAAAPAAVDLPSLIPAPADTQQTKGPNQIADNGIHMFYQVNGAPNDVLNAYKSALESKGWQVTTIVTSAGGSSGGGATYTGTHGDAYGVFDGGGYNTSTFIDVCTWPAKPANPNCSRSDR
ncbi:hypothetical protein A5784_02715 [Mycobacterium sp. 852013-50091_SCH5140682]|uniref:hypothetical protein n=1 Tax=Mycobacterium sp. 852013-50091_SCH5140682 TaxID=1834109 RepID=UPI0007E951A8|nr:hypothetical protein [Mycobacterium sp. 852013-50091_SCH5140682]OBC15349.1 hypothetical protein A5784_02715 [Mycobacterium sp. 852013-50091_SCH5140682]